jgi:hypothetical protein
MNTLNSENNEKRIYSVLKLRLRVNNAMNTAQRNFDLLIDNVINSQKGLLQPQVIYPFTLMEALIKSVSAFPKDTSLPFPLCKDSVHLLLRFCDLQVYIKNGILGYVILVPLVNRGNFITYSLIPIPVLWIEPSSCIYKQVSHSCALTKYDNIIL